MHARRGRIRLGVVMAVLVVVAVLAAACDSSSDESAGTTTSSPTTTTTLPTPIDDQTPPVGANGLAFGPDGQLWVADLVGSQVLSVDPETGAILARFGADEGVVGPDDVAIAADGSIYWTGFVTGVVGRISPAGENEIIAELSPGANPITFTDDGRLLVGLAEASDALYEIDPEGSEEPRLIAEELGDVNAFAVGPDGFLYGPRFGLNGEGAVVRIDIESGEATEVTDGFNFPAAVKFDADGSLYVLHVISPELFLVDVDSGELTSVTEPPTALVDNFAIADDGRFFVTAFNEPVISVISVDGETRTITIGEPPS